MTNATIKIETSANAVASFLLHPLPNQKAEGLTCPGTTNPTDLNDGLYNVSLAGTGEVAGTNIKITFATATSSKTRNRWVKKDGSIGDLVDFGILNGKVL